MFRYYRHYEPGYQDEFESGSQSEFFQFMNKVSSPGPGYSANVVYTSRVIDDTGQGHELVEVTVTQKESSFIGGVAVNCLRVGQCWRHGGAGAYGDSKSIVRGDLIEIDPQTRFGHFLIHSVDDIKLRDPIESWENTVLKINAPSYLEPVSMDGWRNA